MSTPAVIITGPSKSALNIGQQIQSVRKPTWSAKGQIDNADALTQLQNAFYKLEGVVAQLVAFVNSISPSPSPSPGFGGGWNPVPVIAGNATPNTNLGQSQYILAASSPVHINTAVTAGNNPPWFLFLAQDGTGGRHFTFDAAYILHAALPQTLSLAPNTYNVLLFVTNPLGRQMLVYTSPAYSAA